MWYAASVEGEGCEWRVEGVYIWMDLSLFWFEQRIL